MTASAAFGEALKDWRTRRRLSQLDLALEAEVSARHISFLETGRSAPSRDMVLMLADTLDLPFRARNQLLVSAGFAAAYAETPLDAAALAPVRQALEFTMDRHAPFPALICDRHWNLVNANATARMLLGVGENVAGVNLVRLIATQPMFREAIVNWAEVMIEFRHRVRLEARASGNDPVLAELTGVFDPLGIVEQESQPDSGSPFLTIKMRKGDMRLSLFSTIASFGTARDITLSDLRIELFFPADEATAQILRGLGRPD